MSIFQNMNLEKTCHTNTSCSHLNYDYEILADNYIHYLSAIQLQFNL